MLPRVLAVSEPSVEVAVTDRVKSASLSAAGVMLRPARSPVSSVQLPSPLSVPALRLAPAGTPEMVMLRVSEASLSADVISSAIA